MGSRESENLRSTHLCVVNPVGGPGKASYYYEYCSDFIVDFIGIIVTCALRLHYRNGVV